MERRGAQEGNPYFPLESLNRRFFEPSDKRIVCAWKGTAHYYDVVRVDGKRNPAAAWTYPEPKEAALEIRDHVAFWNGVRVED